jgi:hypothetical protein
VCKLPLHDVGSRVMKEQGMRLESQAVADDGHQCEVLGGKNRGPKSGDRVDILADCFCRSRALLLLGRKDGH